MLPDAARAELTPRAFMDSFDEFRAPSWDAWRAILARLTSDVREFYAVAGRGSGKSRIVALLAVCFAAHEYRRAPGEQIFIGVFAPDRKQSAVTFKYITGLMRSVPELAALIANETRESLELSTGVVIEVITASASAPRGRGYALVIVEEAAFLDADEFSAEPDVELIRAVRPALARIPGSLLAVIGSPWRRRGVLFEAWRSGDADDRVVVAADTLTLNPTFRQREVERAFEVDPVAARWIRHGRSDRVPGGHQFVADGRGDRGGGAGRRAGGGAGAGGGRALRRGDGERRGRGGARRRVQRDAGRLGGGAAVAATVQPERGG